MWLPSAERRPKGPADKLQPGATDCAGRITGSGWPVFSAFSRHDGGGDYRPATSIHRPPIAEAITREAAEVVGAAFRVTANLLSLRIAPAPSVRSFWRRLIEK